MYLFGMLQAGMLYHSGIYGINTVSYVQTNIFSVHFIQT
jgi:hypothetical protein